MIRRGIRKFIRERGYDVTRKPPAMTRPDVELLPSMEMIAALVGVRVGRPTFVQVGAYDGQTNDPLVDVATTSAWRGVFVEPQPRAFAKLQAFRAGQPNFYLKRAAIAPVDGERTMYSIRETPGLPDWAYQLTSFDRAHVARAQRDLPGFDIAALITSETVPCVTFDSLLAAAEVDHVDILQIDTEGFDYEVLKLFDIPRRLPAAVGFEHVHLSKDDWNAAVELLVGAGYLVGRGYMDTVAFRRASCVPKGDAARSAPEV